jgi:hypothetical protein
VTVFHCVLSMLLTRSSTLAIDIDAWKLKYMIVHKWLGKYLVVFLWYQIFQMNSNICICCRYPTEKLRLRSAVLSVGENQPKNSILQYFTVYLWGSCNSETMDGSVIRETTPANQIAFAKNLLLNQLWVLVHLMPISSGTIF